MAVTTRGKFTREAAPKPRNDAYTGLLLISFLALVTSSILLYLDYNQYGTTTAPKVSIPAPGSSTVSPTPGPPVDPPPMGDAPAPMGDMPPMGAPMGPMVPMGPMGAPGPMAPG